jgi:type IV pilus assembly protein PilN
MAIVRINLLPHREQKRQARQRQFVSLAILSVLTGLLAVGIGYGVLQSRIDNQQSRNALLKTEIAKLDEQIKEIDRLREQIQAVIARKQIVETLQANRSEAVHLIDQLVRQLPDGVYLTSVKQIGPKVTLVGYAQSNARVSTLMRNIDSSPWVAQPELVEIRLVPAPGSTSGQKLSQFTLNLQIKKLAPPATPAGPAPANRPPAKGGPA